MKRAGVVAAMVRQFAILVLLSLTHYELRPLCLVPSREDEEMAPRIPSSSIILGLLRGLAWHLVSALHCPLLHMKDMYCLLYHDLSKIPGEQLPIGEPRISALPQHLAMVSVL